LQGWFLLLCEAVKLGFSLDALATLLIINFGGRITSLPNHFPKSIFQRGESARKNLFDIFLAKLDQELQLILAIYPSRTPMMLLPTLLKKVVWINLATAALFFFAARVQAVIIKGGDGTGNTTAPSDAIGCPGWSYVGHGNYSAVYLGNGWVLTCNHVGAANTNFNGTDYTYDPTSVQRLRQTADTTSNPIDLILYRINAPPVLPSLSISNTTPTKNSLVTGIGFGRDRGTAITIGDPPVVQGYNWGGDNSTKRWGRNLISSLSDVLVNVGGGNAPNYTFLTAFDSNPSTTKDPNLGFNEFQAAAGDSGGGVFLNDNGIWKLAGIIQAVAPHNDPAYYGDNTYSIDLSYYRDQIVSTVKVFQISSMVNDPVNVVGAGWQNVQLIADGGFGSATGTRSIPVDTNGHAFTVDTGANTVEFSPSAGTQTGIISGSGSLIKNGTGILILSAANTYSGSTTVNSGILQLAGGNNRLPVGTSLNLTNTLASGLNLNNFSQTLGSLSGGGNLGGNIFLGSGNLTVGNAASTTYSGVISGTGSLIKTGTGMLTLTGANTYAGCTNLMNGTLSFASGSLNSTSFVSFTGDATLQWNGHSQDISGKLLINDGITATIDTNGRNLVFANPLLLGTNKTGGLAKTGQGELTLVENPTYTGDTTVLQGVLNVGTLNTPNATVAVYGNSTLNASSIVADSLIISSTIPASVYSEPETSQSIVIVPEPFSSTLLLSGLLGSIAFYWIRRR
jgi:autotransporter-associated beta strand protein